jgi:stress-induced-phosphoprotein 1
MMTRIAMDPKLRGYLNDPSFMAKIKTLQRDPNQLSTMLGDPRIMEVFQSMLNLNFDRDEEGDDIMGRGFGDHRPSPPATTPSTTYNPSSNAKTQPEKKAEPAPPTTVEEVEDDDDEDMVEEVNPAEQDKKEKLKAAMKAKEKGNELYSKKMFDEAIAAYDEAISLDPTNMTYLSNKAAVYFTTKKYDECISACMDAVELGKANRASFEDRAKALTRCAKAYQSKGDLAMAIEMCKRSQLESFNKDTERLLKNMELEKRKADALAYQDDDKAEESKQLGNNYFRNKDWAKAVEAYEEAVKRAPKNASIRNNLAAALSKIMDFNGAKREIELAVELDPHYVKAWARKGDIEILTKEYHKALESYRKGLELEPDNPSCKEGLQKVTALINYGSANMTESERKERAAHAMADPQIQAILQDPIIIQVLRDFQENPRAANEAMRDAVVRSKIEKLVASGIVQMG